MQKVPLGIFWDIENVPNLNILRKKSNGIAKGIREFIEKIHPECNFPIEFCCAWDTRNKEDISKRLSNNGVDVLYANATSKNAADEKLKEAIDKFVYQNFPGSVIVIITGDINFKRSLQIAMQKGFQCVLLYGDSASMPLINLVKESYSMDEILDNVNDELNEEIGQPVTIKVMGWPSNVKLDLIHKRLSMLSINCGGKIIKLTNDYALITYVCSEDANRSLHRISRADAFGKMLSAELYVTPIKSVNTQENATNDEKVNPDLFDSIPETTKSVITGLYTKRTDNVLLMVRNFVKSWNEKDCEPEMIDVVFRNKKFSDKDGKAELFITAISEKSNYNIVSVAKKRFNNTDKQIFWRLFNFNYIKTDYNYDDSSYDNYSSSTTGINSQNTDNNSKSVIKGLRTRREENVLIYVRKIVMQWRIDPNLIQDVERSKSLCDSNGRALLFVTIVNEEWSKKIVNIARVRFNNVEKSVFWLTFGQYKYEESLDEINFIPEQNLNENKSILSLETFDFENNYEKNSENIPEFIVDQNSDNKNVLLISESKLREKLNKIRLNTKLFASILYDLIPDLNNLKYLYQTLIGQKNKYITNMFGIHNNREIDSQLYNVNEGLTPLLSYYENCFGNNLKETKINGFDENNRLNQFKTNNSDTNGFDNNRIDNNHLDNNRPENIRSDNKKSDNNKSDNKKSDNNNSDNNSSDNSHSDNNRSENKWSVNIRSNNNRWNNIRSGNIRSDNNSVETQRPEKYQGFDPELEIRKSIISGVWSDYTDDVLKLVQEHIDSWDEDDICGEDIIDVGRDSKYRFCNGKVLLFVTAKTKDKNEILLKLAEKHFNNPEKDVIWRKKIFRQKTNYLKN